MKKLMNNYKCWGFLKDEDGKEYIFTPDDKSKFGRKGVVLFGFDDDSLSSVGEFFSNHPAAKNSICRKVLMLFENKPRGTSRFEGYSQKTILKELVLQGVPSPIGAHITVQLWQAGLLCMPSTHALWRQDQFMFMIEQKGWEDVFVYKFKDGKVSEEMMEVSDDRLKFHAN